MIDENVVPNIVSINRYATDYGSDSNNNILRPGSTLQKRSLKTMYDTL